MYEEMTKILQRFTNTEKLKECHHGHSSQKNESLNTLVSRYCPKDKTFSHSTSLAGRICMVVGVDSVGHEEYYERSFAGMNILLPKNTRKQMKKMKIQRDYDRMYQALPVCKRKRSMNKFATMRVGLAKQNADKARGLLYGTGMNLAETSDPNPKAKKELVCKFCGKTGHATTRSRSCKYNGMDMALVDADIVAVYATKATEQAVSAATALATSEVQSEGKCDYFGVC